MVNAPSYWAYLVANVGFVAVGCLLAGLSMLAYRVQRGQKSYAIAGVGFGCIVLGGVTESAYAFLSQPDFLLSGREFLLLQAGEDIFVAVGLGLVFYAISKHDPDSSEVADGAAPGDGNDLWTNEKPNDE